MVVASCLKGVGNISIFDLNCEFQTINLSLQLSSDDACIDGLLLSLQSHSTLLTIYAHDPKSRLNSVYMAKKTSMWNSEPAHFEIDYIRYEIGNHQTFGLAIYEIDVPNSPCFKVFIDLLTFQANFFKQSNQEFFKDDERNEPRNLLNNLPVFDTAFTEQIVYLGSTHKFDFTVSDLDSDALSVYFGVCPDFAANLQSLATDSFRLTISPPLNEFSLVGKQSCELRLDDSIGQVAGTLQINVQNRPPYLTGTITTQSVPLNGHLVLNPSLNFRDDDGHSLSIDIARFTFNGVTTAIPGSIFSFLAPNKIKVGPVAFSDVGSYTIEVSFTDSLYSSGFGSFNVQVTNTAPRFTSVIPTVSAPFGVTTTVNLSSYIIDDEWNPISVLLTSTFSGTVSSFPTPIFSQPSPTSISIYPPSSAYNGETHLITVKIEDGEPLYSTTTFTVNIVRSNIVPTFDVTFTTQEIYLGQSINLDFTVSDGDDDTMTLTKDGCPAYTFLNEQVKNSYRLAIQPPLTDFTHLGLKSCKLILDDSFAKVERTLSINVLNRRPQLSTSISRQSVGVNGHLIIDPSSNFIDEDGHSLTIFDAQFTFNTVKSQIPGSFFTIVSSKIQVDPTSSSQIGAYSVDVRYTDSNLVSAYGTFILDVTNAAPVFSTSIPWVNRAYNSASYRISLSSYFSDPNGDTLTMSATYVYGTNSPASIPGGIFTKPAAYDIEVTPTSFTQIGDYTIALTVIDSLGLSATSSFTVSITNSDPTWTAIPPQSMVNELGKSIPLQSYYSDREGGPITIQGTYLFVPSGGSAGSILNIPGGIFSWSSAGTLAISSPSSTDAGTYTIFLTAKDEASWQSEGTSFTLTISSTAPQLVKKSPPNISLVHQQSTSINLASYFVDVQDYSLAKTATYSQKRAIVTAIPGGIFAKPNQYQIDVASTSISDTGTYFITMTVADNFPMITTASFTLSITNAAPRVVTVPGSFSLVHGGSLIIPLDSNFVDNDGDAITMIATYKTGGGAAVKIPNGIFTLPSPFKIGVTSTSVADTGVYTIKLIVSDPLQQQVTQQFIVSVTNAEPRITNPPPSPSIVHGQSISMPLDGCFIDDDGDTIKMTATYKFNGGAATAIPGGIFTQPTAFQLNVATTSISNTGTYVISLQVSDPQPLTVTTSFTLTITNVAPKIVQQPSDYSIIHGSSIIIPLTSNFADDDGDAITMVATYSLNGGSAVAIPNGIFNMPSAFTIDVASTSIKDSGSYKISLTVSDQLPSSVSTYFILNITNAPLGWFLCLRT